jgi:hypothetical protein
MCNFTLNLYNPFPVNQQSMEQYLQIATLRVLLDENIRLTLKAINPTDFILEMEDDN